MEHTCASTQVVCPICLCPPRLLQGLDGHAKDLAWPQQSPSHFGWDVVLANMDAISIDSQSDVHPVIDQHLHLHMKLAQRHFLHSTICSADQTDYRRLHKP